MYKPGVIRRRMTGIGLAAFFIVMWTLQGWFMRVSLTALEILAVLEMYGALAQKGFRPARWVGVAYAALTAPAFFFLGGFSGLFLMTATLMVVGMTWVVLRGDIEGGSLVATLFPVLYPAMPFAVLQAMTAFTPQLAATVAIGCTYLVSVMGDMLAYEIGTLYGKRPLAPRISPKKTREGAAAGLAASVATAILIPALAKLACEWIPLFQKYASPLPALWQFALLGVVAGAASQAGDLAASMVKRYCGVKDYGAIFPGHGGVMDRMDGVLFCGVCVYVFFAVGMR